MLFTTASSTLVAPHLTYGNWENSEIYGKVQGTFANPQFLADTCQTPINPVLDPSYGRTTCLAFSYTDVSLQDFDAYIQVWSDISDLGVDIGADLTNHPQAFSSVFPNVKIRGSWVQTEYSNLSGNCQRYGRIVNNITLSMPHAGIYGASQDERNKISQPIDGSGLGEYSLRAQVVAPTSNTLCVNLNASELAPSLYDTWPYARFSNTSTGILGQKGPEFDLSYSSDIIPVPGQIYFNSTVVDDILEWGTKYGRQPPVFPFVGRLTISNLISTVLYVESH